mmetsp:Transcript_6303/g.21690  ORF Transcript_6303/g.21690 Transcript_6303/m.21690 type:complete len:490 (+) Transcript_6303:228-1697(+)
MAISPSIALPGAPSLLRRGGGRRLLLLVHWVVHAFLLPRAGELAANDAHEGHEDHHEDAAHHNRPDHLPEVDVHAIRPLVDDGAVVIVDLVDRLLGTGGLVGKAAELELLRAIVGEENAVELELGEAQAGVAELVRALVRVLGRGPEAGPRGQLGDVDLDVLAEDLVHVDGEVEEEVLRRARLREAVLHLPEVDVDVEASGLREHLGDLVDCLGDGVHGVGARALRLLDLSRALEGLDEAIGIDVLEAISEEAAGEALVGAGGNTEELAAGVGSNVAAAGPIRGAELVLVNVRVVGAGNARRAGGNEGGVEKRIRLSVGHGPVHVANVVGGGVAPRILEHKVVLLHSVAVGEVTVARARHGVAARLGRRRAPVGRGVEPSMAAVLNIPLEAVGGIVVVLEGLIEVEAEGEGADIAQEGLDGRDVLGLERDGVVLLGVGADVVVPLNLHERVLARSAPRARRGTGDGRRGVKFLRDVREALLERDATGRG